MGLLKEFREFAIRGNVTDMAVGIIVGAAFTGVVTSLVNQVLMPPIGMLLGRTDFSKFTITLSEAVGDKPAVVIAYGAFINTLINFLIVALVVFLIVKQINKLKRMSQTEAPAPAVTKDCPFCASTIPTKAVRCPQCTSSLSA